MPRKVSPYGLFRDFFDGTYKSSGQYRNKADAEKRALALKKQGRVVRITTSNDYDVIMGHPLLRKTVGPYTSKEARNSYDVWYKVN